jgi:hypothetical protein
VFWSVVETTALNVAIESEAGGWAAAVMGTAADEESTAARAPQAVGGCAAWTCVREPLSMRGARAPYRRTCLYATAVYR